MVTRGLGRVTVLVPRQELGLPLLLVEPLAAQELG